MIGPIAPTRAYLRPSYDNQCPCSPDCSGQGRLVGPPAASGAPYGSVECPSLAGPQRRAGPGIITAKAASQTTSCLGARAGGGEQGTICSSFFNTTKSAPILTKG